MNEINKIDNSCNQLPLFVLDLFLLVGGRTRLRVFEPRYIKLVRLAVQGNGFIIAQKAGQTCLASWVKVINFDQGADDILEIDVECIHIVQIYPAYTDAEHLHFVTYQAVRHWSEIKRHHVNSDYFNSLNLVIDRTPLLTSLYAQDIDEDDSWVIARWLELLPLSFKEQFFYQVSFDEALHTVKNIIK